MPLNEAEIPSCSGVENCELFSGIHISKILKCFQPLKLSGSGFQDPKSCDAVEFASGLQGCRPIVHAWGAALFIQYYLDATLCEVYTHC